MEDSIATIYTDISAIINKYHIFVISTNKPSIITRTTKMDNKPDTPGHAAYKVK